MADVRGASSSFRSRLSARSSEFVAFINGAESTPLKRDARLFFRTYLARSGKRSLTGITVPPPTASRLFTSTKEKTVSLKIDSFVRDQTFEIITVNESFL